MKVSSKYLLVLILTSTIVASCAENKQERKSEVWIDGELIELVDDSKDDTIKLIRDSNNDHLGSEGAIFEKTE